MWRSKNTTLTFKKKSAEANLETWNIEAIRQGILYSYYKYVYEFKYENGKNW